jgi:hypothetical protein
MSKRLFFGISALLLGGAIVAEEAYRWVDADGVVHYSDRPEPGADAIQLPTYQPPAGSRTPAPTPTGNNQSRNTTQGENDTQPFSYESLSIASPAAEETLWNIEGVLNVSLSLAPALQSGHRVRVYFDGTPQMVSGTSFQLEGVYRGVHNLQAEVIDQSGRLKIRSQPGRFYVQQNAIGK